VRSLKKILEEGTDSERSWVNWYIEQVRAMPTVGDDPWPKAEQFWKMSVADSLHEAEAFGDPRRAEHLAMGRIRVRFALRAELIAEGWTVDDQGNWVPPPVAFVG
jgi:hypothetical protein